MRWWTSLYVRITKRHAKTVKRHVTEVAFNGDYQTPELRQHLHMQIEQVEWLDDDR